jgi:hypothetical protein
VYQQTVQKPARQSARRIPASKPSAPVQGLLALQHRVGNRALARLLSEPGAGTTARPHARSGRRLARVIDENTWETSVLLQGELATDEYKELVPALVQVCDALFQFVSLSEAERTNPANNGLVVVLRDRAMALNKQAVTLSEDRAESRSDPQQQGPLGRLKRLAAQVERDTNAIAKTLSLTEKARRHDQVVSPGTAAALAGGTARHLLITPRPGTREAEGAGQLFPQGVSAAQEMWLALPAKAHIRGEIENLHAAPTRAPLEVLAIGGGHGGVGALFEQENVGSFSAGYWRDHVVRPLVDHGVKANVIVLDACLTVSLIDVFEPLCAPGGKIVASMYSINSKFMTPEVWSEIFAAEQGQGNVGEVLEKRGRHIAAHAAEDAAEALVGAIRSNPSDEVEDLVKAAPELLPIVSQVRYLARISDSVGSFKRARTDLRREEVMTDLKNLLTSRPPPAPPEAQLLSTVIQMLDDSDTWIDQVIDYVRERLQAVTKSGDQDLAALERAVRRTAVSGLAGSPLTKVPAQFAIYDAAARSIRYDKLFDDPVARENVVLTTGAESRGEMSGIVKALERFKRTQLAQLAPVETGVIM